MSDSRLILPAPAKLNLHLSVVGRREDGYHLLESLMVKLDLADRLEVALLKPGAGLELEVREGSAPGGESNLVLRAARAFFEAAGLELGAGFVLEKRIPEAAGLGGGSSDAAAALIGLNRLCGHPLDDRRLAALGLALGADIPFFLFPGVLAWASGIGEKLAPGPRLPALYFLLVNPGWPLSTAGVFAGFKLLTNRRREHINWADHESSFTIERFLSNDLETVVMPRYPELDDIRSRLLEAGANGALMTGSGPTVFGVFLDREDRDRAWTNLKGAGEGRWIILPADVRPAENGFCEAAEASLGI